MTIVRIRSQNYTIHQSYRDTNNRHTDNGGLRQVTLAVEGTLQSKNKLTPTDSSVVRATDTWSKGRGFDPCTNGGTTCFLQCQLSVLTLISVSVPPRVTAVARNRSRSLCQKRSWQVTAKHTCTVRMCLRMKWHCKLVHCCMV